jgi:hypothetical protein
MDYLIHHGSEYAIRDMRAHMMELQALTMFQHMDEHFQDVGQNGNRFFF